MIFEFLDSSLKQVAFDTRSGTLLVERGVMARTSCHCRPTSLDHLTNPACANNSAKRSCASALQHAERALYCCRLGQGWRCTRPERTRRSPARASQARCLGPDRDRPGDEGYDFVSRFFAPDKGVPEDPVTGSAHCALTPYWAKRLGKKTLKARQVSPRGGDLICTDDGERTILSGPCALYMTAEITI